MARNSEAWTHAPESLEKGYFVDPKIYVDDGIFREEQEKIFEKVWLIACHESEIEARFDYRTYKHPAGHNLIIVRGEDDKIRAFLNICPHRGNALVSESSGNFTEACPSGGPYRITCIFHAWAFDMKGECVDIPRRAEGYQERVKKCDFGLREVRVEVGYGGFVWVNMDDSAPTLKEHLAGALDSLEPMLSEPLEIFHYHRAIIDGNFKMWHDTNSELYHDYLHYHNRITGFPTKEYWERKFITYKNGHAQVTGMRLKYDNYGSQAKRNLGWPGLPPNGWALVDLFPGITFNIRAPAFRIDTAIPIGPNRLFIEFRGFGLKSDTPEQRARRINDHNSIWGPFGRNLPEDLLALTGQGQALADRSEAPFILHGRNENNKIHDEVGMRHFYQEWSRRIGRSPSEPFAVKHQVAAE
jgi:methanesulfonate monooxygenase large subunit